MRFCQTCKHWFDTTRTHHCLGGPEDGHTFRFSMTSRGSYGVVGQEGHTDAEWFTEEPWTLEVRAWNLTDALRKAAELPMSAWTMPAEPEGEA